MTTGIILSNNYTRLVGVNVTYDRVLELEVWSACLVCELFEEDGVVTPADIQKGICTVGILENLDYNPSSTIAVDTFHSIDTSVFQKLILVKTDLL